MSVCQYYDNFSATFVTSEYLKRIGIDFYEYFTTDIKEIRKLKLLQCQKSKKNELSN